MLFSKLSFAVTLLRLTDGWLKKLVWFIIITLTLGLVSSSLMFWIRCDPPEATWNPHIKVKKCWNSNSFLSYSIAGGSEYLIQNAVAPKALLTTIGPPSLVYSALCDIVLALLPWRILLQFRMYRGEKVGVAVAMSMGVL